MTSVALDIKPLLTHWDRSGPITVRLSGLPSGARLSAGTPGAGGCWEMGAEALDGLSLMPPDDCGATALYLGLHAGWTRIFKEAEVEYEQTLLLRVELPRRESLDFTQLIPRWGGLGPFASR